MSIFGTGIELDTEFDLSVSPISGSIAIESGTDVIERDVAFTLAREGGRFRGEPNPDAFGAGIEATVRDVLTRDPRITGVRDIAVSSQTDPQAIAVNVRVLTATEETEALLIELSQ